MRLNRAFIALLLAALAAATVAAPAGESNPVRRHPVAGAEAHMQRVIVKFRTGSGVVRSKAQSAQASVAALAKRSGLNLRASREIGSGMHVMRVDAAASGESLQGILERLRGDPDVEFAEEDRRRYAHAVPADPLFVNQWYWKKAEASAINAADAWDTTVGAADVVVAVVDTGVRYDHPDLQRQSSGGRLLDGYDFVSEEGPGEFKVANDGDGWDADASDPGDWIDEDDRATPLFSDCEASDSSWHGTRVSGIVGARTNNAEGIAGGTWEGSILPVRVLGKCGGYDSDILAGVRWAAGLTVTGVPVNPNPAKIINMSLGATSTCPTAYQTLFAQLDEQGVLVVVSAGNEAGRAVDSPANCPRALGVTGLRHVGSKVGYSNIGPEVGISAPGGNCVNVGAGEPCLYSLDTTTNLGATAPGASGYTDQFNSNLGTSFSAPIVAVAAALVRSVNTKLAPSQIILRLQQSATPFPTLSNVPACTIPTATSADQLECNCTTSTCGAGMVDAAAAVAAAMRPFVIAVATPSSPEEGETVALDGTGSFAADDRTIATYAWTVVSAEGDEPALSGADTDTASFVAGVAGAVTVRLTVTDSEGEQDTADVVVTTPDPPPPPSPSPSPSPKSGGGGGAMDLVTLLAGLAVLVSSWIRAGAAARRRACPAPRASHASGPRAPGA